ncbi:MAG: hypothetical protein ABI643_03345 [Candidatus Doudnabacteria bacterium]
MKLLVIGVVFLLVVLVLDKAVRLFLYKPAVQPTQGLSEEASKKIFDAIKSVERRS